MDFETEIESPLGLKPLQIAMEMRALHYELLEEEPKEVDADTRNRWLTVVDRLFEFARGGAGGSATVLTSSMVGFFDLRLNEMHPFYKYVWMATIRFGLNLVTAGTRYDPAETMDELRAELASVRAFKWRGWIENQIIKNGVK